MCSAIGRARQAKIPRNLPTHALWVADASAFGMRRDIEPHGAIGVIDASGQIQSAAADLRRHIFKKQARGVEDKIALDAAQSSWEIDCTRLRVVDMYFSCDARTIQCAFEHRVNLRGAARLEVRDKSA